MRIFHYNSPLMRFLSRLADIILLNIVYLICCLPVITAGAATTALYSCAMGLDEPEEQPLLKRFFKSFGRDFGRSTALLMVWAAAMVLVLVNLWFYQVLLRDMDGVLRILPMIPAALFLLCSSYLFPLQARFDNSFAGVLKNAFSLTIVHLPATVFITAINLIPVLVLYFKTDVFIYLLPMWSLLGFALIAYLNGYFLNRIFRAHIPRQEE